MTWSIPAPYNGNLYVGCEDWNLYCFGDARIMNAVAPQASVVPSQTAAPMPSQTAAPMPSQTAAPMPSQTAAPIISLLPSQAPQPTSGMPTTTYIAIAAVVVIIAVVAAAVALRRRK